MSATTMSAAPAPYFGLLRHARALLVLPVAVFVLAFLFIPTATVLVNSFLSPSPTGDQAFTLENYWLIISDEFYWEVILRSLRISGMAVFCAVLLGYPAALYVFFSESRWRKWFLFIVVSPLFLSSVVRIYGWVMVFTPTGALNWLLPGDISVNLLRTEWAVIIGMTHIYIPFMILSINSALVRQDKRLLSAAASLGASNLQIFRSVVLPLSLPGIVAGSVIVFAVTMTAFGPPVLLGGSSNKTLAFMAYQKNLTLANPHEGGALSLVLVACSLGVAWMINQMAKPVFKRIGV